MNSCGSVVSLLRSVFDPFLLFSDECGPTHDTGLEGKHIARSACQALAAESQEVLDAVSP